MATTTLDAITTAEVKAFHGITNASKDTIIDVHRPLVVDLIKQYCRHDFESKARVNEKPRIERGDQFFFLINRPVISPITSLVEDGTTLVEDTDFHITLDTGRVEKILDQRLFHDEDPLTAWTKKRNAIIVNYTGGEILTQDVVLVFYELVGISAQLKTKTFITNEGIEAAITLTSIPAHLLEILDRHRNVRIFGSK